MKKYMTHPDGSLRRLMPKRKGKRARRTEKLIRLLARRGRTPALAKRLAEIYFERRLSYREAARIGDLS